VIEQADALTAADADPRRNDVLFGEYVTFVWGGAVLLWGGLQLVWGGTPPAHQSADLITSTGGSMTRDTVLF
jgi:hypothetical protein